jgi:hypothetical protein
MGNNYDPVTLHKYLYANADPGNLIDPTGNFSIGGMMSAINVMGRLSTIATNTYDLFQIATGEKELSARDIGISVLMAALPTKALGIFTRGCKNSFEEGTLVHTSRGLVPIENVSIGDYVLSYNETTEQQEWNEVVHLIQGEKEYELVVLVTEAGEQIVSTKEHPFFTSDAWMDATDLFVGEKIKTPDGSIKIKDKHVTLAHKKVFNLTVENAHTYYIGESGLLVHNAGGCFKFDGRIGNGYVKASKDALEKEVDAAVQIAGYKGKSIFVRGKTAEGADFIMDNVLWELKTLNSASANAVRNNIKKAIKKGQSRRIVIDGREVGLSIDDFNKGLSDAIRQGWRPAEVLILLPGKGNFRSWPF